MVGFCWGRNYDILYSIQYMYALAIVPLVKNADYIVPVMARILKRMQEQQMKNRDKRTRLMSELLANIKRFVMGAW